MKHLKTWLVSPILAVAVVLPLYMANSLTDAQTVPISEPVASQPTSTAPVFPAVLVAIAKCESEGQQFEPDGSVKRGKLSPEDIGKYQINLPTWGAEAKKLGFDVFTEEGNEQMALEIYRRNGTKDWNASKHCWQK